MINYVYGRGTERVLQWPLLLSECVCVFDVCGCVVYTMATVVTASVATVGVGMINTRCVCFFPRCSSVLLYSPQPEPIYHCCLHPQLIPHSPDTTVQQNTHTPGTRGVVQKAGLLKTLSWVTLK